MPRQPNSPRFSSGSPRKGSETPRIWTPPLRDLTPETTRGFECIDFAEQILEIELFPWQKWLLLHALETHEDGTYRFRTVLLLVARQNGKSTLMLVLALWRMFADGAPLVIGTAQNLDIAEELWTAAYEMAESIPELARLIEHVDKTNGKKAMRLTSGERYKVATASRRGGRGLSGDLVLLDELREHQSWDAWGAVTKTTLARRFAQVWAASNAGDLASIVLRYLRGIAHRGLGFPDGDAGISVDTTQMDDDDEFRDGDDDSLGIFEWSARPDRTPRDRDGWAEANPSLGYTITEKALASAANTDPEWVFRTEVMCQWVSTSEKGPFPAGAWGKLLDTREQRIARGVTRDKDRPAAYGIDLSHDRKMAYVAIAFWDTEGRRRVEIAAQRAGIDWLVPWLLSPERKIRPDHVTIQTNGSPISSMVDLFEQAGIDLTTWAGRDLVGACGMFFDAVQSAVDEDEPIIVLTHDIQPVLDVAANTAAIRALNDGWVIDRRNSPEDAAPLMAAIGAHWLLMTGAEPKFVSAYSDADLSFI